MISSTKRYLLRGSKTIGFDSMDSGQRLPKQDLERSKGIRMQLPQKYQSDEYRTNSSSDHTFISAVEVANADRSIEDVDIEKYYTNECFPELQAFNYLSAWSPPNITDRRSALISVPVPSVQVSRQIVPHYIWKSYFYYINVAEVKQDGRF